MSRQVTPQLSRDAPPMQAWVQLLRAHSSITKRFNSDLVQAHGLTLNDYEVLLRLAHSPEGAMRRVDLAESVLLTASGITRLLEGLERQGYVERRQCQADARVSYAALTECGYAKLRESAETHLESIRAFFSDRLSDDDAGTLAALLGRLSGEGDGPPCSPPEP